MNSDDAARQAALQIYQRFTQSQQPQPSIDYFSPPPGYVDPDPATTYDPHPLVTAVQNAVTTANPGAFGGIYQTPDGVIHVGLVGGTASQLAQTATGAAPGATVQIYSAKYSWSQLLAIANDVVKAMANDSTGIIVSVTPDPTTNTVQVGVTNTTSPVAQAVAAQYGNAVNLVDDQPIEPLVGSAVQERPAQSTALAAAARKPYPDRAKYHQPGYAGLYITVPKGTPGSPNGAACTDGFGYHFGSPNGPYYETGFYTAAHCVILQPPLTIWNQGGKSFGPWTRRSYNPGAATARSDAATITTNNTSTITYRKSSNLVAIAPGVPPAKITRREALNAGQRGDRVEVSGAISGVRYGTLLNGGVGGVYKESGGTIITGVYKAKLNAPLVPGDSGAPVFEGTSNAVALGILNGRSSSTNDVAYYSQIALVENSLGVVTNTKAP
ncbi:MAG: S1 family peptidase [Actinomycetota bacterium]|nr:S1 family peptidase [Actinomycetota bacterium]